MQQQPQWVHPSTVGTLTRSRRVVLLLSLLLWLIHPLDTKLRCLALSLGYSFIEYNFTYFERGKAYTSMAQFVANVLYMPLLVDLYSHFLWRFPFLYMSLFPINIWLLEIVQGLAIQWIYGRNVAWCYADYADELFNGLIRIGHAIWWWGLGVALWLFYPFIQRASLHLAQLGTWDDPQQGTNLLPLLIQKVRLYEASGPAGEWRLAQGDCRDEKTGETQLETSVMWKLMALSHGVSSCKRTDKLKEEKTLWPYSHTLQGDMPLTHLPSHVSMFVHVLSSFRVSGRIKFNIPESILSSPFRRFANDLPQASRVFDFGENCEAVHLDDGSRAQREAVELEIAPIFLCWVLLLSCF